ncbi:unnamed protein product [Peronospora belbahrii]|uniref:Asparaginyl-tRNA synthetase n=1 Tax=Peronospora belbahrii TaxID=622444 RepID=A0ABN8CU37_9STRA|nr:unnamed protein product [Peronospora belbahrii]
MKLEGNALTVKGWAKTLRVAGAGAFAFLELNDGSCFTGVQCVINKEETEGFADAIASGGVGASYSVEGIVVKSPAKGQEIELNTAKTVKELERWFGVTTLLSQHPDGKLPLTKENKVDYAKDFFDRPSYLSVSGQLNVETHCCALSDVYTFGPTFRAGELEYVSSICEFWTIEPEIALADPKDDIDLAEDYLETLRTVRLWITAWRIWSFSTRMWRRACLSVWELP